MVIKSFKDLIVWQKSYQAALTIYRVTKLFPKEENYGLISQLRRSIVSVGANICEGGKKGSKEFIRYLNIAEGSLEESKFYILLAQDLQYIDHEIYKNIYDELNQIGYMINALKKKIKQRLY